jgi:RNA polymerase sigma factor (sigma-70 family)
VTTPAPVKALDAAALAALVAWAVRTAMARAEVRGVHVDEVVSEALHGIHRALRTYAGGTTPSDHVRRRVRGAILDATRREKRIQSREVLLDDLEEARPPAVEDDDTLPRAVGVEARVVGSPEASLLGREERALLDLEVTRLPRDDRHLYELRHREGLTWDEISVRTGLPARTARLHDKRIRDHLAEALRAYLDEG